MERRKPLLALIALLAAAALIVGTDCALAQTQQTSRALSNGHQTTAGGSYAITGTLGQVSPGEIRGTQEIELGFWYTILYGRATGIGDDQIPHRFEYQLFQNRPNPFNPRTTISFSLADPGRVSLVLYDVRGRRVADLFSRHYEAGNHHYVFAPSNLASGVYIYRLTAGDFVATRRMLLLK